MTTANLSQSVQDKLPPQFECFPAAEAGVQVRTPLLYPDGDVVDVFVLEQQGGYLVTDYGDGLGWFRSQSIEEHLSPEQQRQLEEKCTALGLELERGQLRLHCAEDKLGEAVQLLAQSVVQVSELLAAGLP